MKTSFRIAAACIALMMLVIGAGATAATSRAAPVGWLAEVRDGEPGAAIVVRERGREVITEARGLLDLDEPRPIRLSTPFYIASVAKPITATLVVRLADRDALVLDRGVGPDFPELPLGDVDPQQLLNHTAGVPDYFQWIDWTRFRRIDDAGVIDTLAARLDSGSVAPGGFAYSNSHYVLLSELIRRRTGVRLATFFAQEFAVPLDLGSAFVDDGDAAVPGDPARGYVPDGAGFRLSSYEEIDLPGAAPVVRPQFATTGAGGVWMSARDLARWAEAVVPDLPHHATAIPIPREDGDHIGEVRGYASGWYVSTLEGHTVFWHSGNRAGFGAVVAIAPDAGLSIAVVANRSDLAPIAIAEVILRTRMTAAK